MSDESWNLVILTRTVNRTDGGKRPCPQFRVREQIAQVRRIARHHEADSLAIKQEDGVFSAGVRGNRAMTGAEADQAVRRCRERIGEIGNLLGKAVAVGDGLEQRRVRKRIGGYPVRLA